MRGRLELLWPEREIEREAAREALGGGAWCEDLADESRCQCAPERWRNRVIEHIADQRRGVRHRERHIETNARKEIAREQNQSGEIERVVEREFECGQRTPGVTDNNRPLDAELREGFVDQRCLAARRPGPAARARTITEAWRSMAMTRCVAASRSISPE